MADKRNALVLVPRQEQNKQEDLIKQVKDLFQVNAVFVLQVVNYHHMSERAKRHMCNTLMPVTICKIPARDGNGMLFFLNKEAAL